MEKLYNDHIIKFDYIFIIFKIDWSFLSLLKTGSFPQLH